MNLKNTALSLLDAFRLNKGRKIVKDPVAPLAPLIQRLSLPPMPGFWTGASKARFVAGVIRQNIVEKKLPKQVAKRVVHKISRYYGLNDLKGFGLFRAVPEKRNMLVPVGA